MAPCMRATLPTGVKWHQKHHVTCSTMGVIYLLQCPCKGYYVRKTRRALNVRISEHLAATRSGFFRMIIGRHIAFSHNYAFNGFKFLPLTVIPPHDRGGDWDRALLQAESRWIFQLHSDRTPGLNDNISFPHFL